MENSSANFVFLAQQPPISKMAVDSVSVEICGKAKRPRDESTVRGRNDVGVDGVRKEPNIRLPMEKNRSMVLGFWSPMVIREVKTIKEDMGGNDSGNFGAADNYRHVGKPSDSGKFGVADNNRHVGKSSDSGTFNFRKSDGAFTKDNIDKSVQVNNGTKSKNSDKGKSSNTDRVSGSRFDILSEDMDVMMVEGKTQAMKIGEGGNKVKGKAMLTEITNQKNYQEKKATRLSSQGSKKNSKLRVKLVTKVDQMVGTRGDASVSMDSSNTSIPAFTPISQELEVDNLDSAQVLRQLHIDVTKFEGQPVEINEVGGYVN
ncbi:hypothetical protein Q3G72_005371 [Acer saccharum]|nr:hypothetical protein Q3G72_005371 [Acer saccharum]